jgi:hypothetical protein
MPLLAGIPDDEAFMPIFQQMFDATCSRNPARRSFVQRHPPPIGIGSFHVAMDALDYSAWK